MTLANGQIAFRGLTVGPGTDFHINRVEGLSGYESRVSDSDQPRTDGALRGLDYVSPRTVALELAVVAEDADGSAYEALWTPVRDAFRPSRATDYDLLWKSPGLSERLIRCRPIQLVRVEEHKNFARRGSPPVVLRAVDPRIYSSQLYSGNVPIYAAVSGGVDLPVGEFPAEFSGGSQNLLVANNAGTADAYPLIRFYGPLAGTCTAVTLTNTTNGDTLTVTTNIASGQILTADMTGAVTGSNRLVISLDGSTRYGDWALPRSAFPLAAGDNLLKFQLTGTSTDVVCNVTWRDTWLD